MNRGTSFSEKKIVTFGTTSMDQNDITRLPWVKSRYCIKEVTTARVEPNSDYDVK